jgi:hypothetical protein
MAPPTEIIAGRLIKQAEWCEQLGSRFYAALLQQAAADVRARGVCFEVLRGHHHDPPDSALALRFLGAVHRLVLRGLAPQLAACYPSAGGDASCEDLWPRFHAAIQQHTGSLAELVYCPVQTNEVGRCAPLLGGFLEVIRCTGLPVRLFEVGAAGGLILRWDRYRYEHGKEGWGDPSSPVRICGAFANAHPDFDVDVKIVDRRGCDASPIDVVSEEGQLTLESFLWPDQVERRRQLLAAIDVARRVPIHIEKANAANWVEAVLDDHAPGVATVIYHSIVWQYLSEGDRTRIKHLISAAGESATPDDPLGWLRFEPGDNSAEVRLQLWPGGEDRLLARSGFHGRPVHWLG